MINIKSGVNFEIAFVWKTAAGAGDTGLVPTVTMYKLSDSSAVFTAQSMTEVAVGIYKYDIATAYLVTGETYAIQADGTASADDATLRYQYMYIAVDYGSTKGIADNVTSILEDTGTTIPALIDALPTAAENTAAILDHDVTAHTTADTVGEALNYLDADISSAGNGTGPFNLEIQYLKTGTTTGWPGIQVWLSTSAVKDASIWGSKQRRTDGNGFCNWDVKAGTYYNWSSKSNTYINKWVVDGSGNITKT